MRRFFFPWRVNIAGVRWGFCADYVVKFASPSCVRFISFGFLLATTCVWVWMVCSLHSVTTGSGDRANVPLIIIINNNTLPGVLYLSLRIFTCANCTVLYCTFEKSRLFIDKLMEIDKDIQTFLVPAGSFRRE